MQRTAPAARLGLTCVLLAACRNPTPPAPPVSPIAHDAGRTRDATVSRPPPPPRDAAVFAARTPTDASIDDAAPPPIHWSRPPVIREVAADAGTLDASSDSATTGATGSADDIDALAVVPTDLGAVAFWMRPAGDDVHTDLVARRLDPDGRYTGTPRRIHRFALNPTLAFDANGTHVWIAWSIRLSSGGRWIEAVEARADLSGVSEPPLSVSRVRPVDGDGPTDVALVATDTGGARLIYAAAHDVWTEEELGRLSGVGGAPGGQPTQYFHVDEIGVDHRITPVGQISDLDYSQENESMNEGHPQGDTLEPFRAMIARVPAGARYEIAWPDFGRDRDEVGWFPGADAGPRPLSAPLVGLLTESHVDAWLWTGAELLMVGHFEVANGPDAATAEQRIALAVRPRPGAADAGIEWRGGAAVRGTVSDIVLACVGSHPWLTVRWPGGEARADLARRDVYGPFAELLPDAMKPDRDGAVHAAWTGRALVVMDGIVPVRWVCGSADGPMQRADPPARDD